MAKKLLVVDKDPSVHSFVEKNLPADKFSLTGINDGLSALDMLDKVKPDMILVEFGLDGIDVFRFFEKVKQKNQEKERPIVLTVGPNDPYEPARLLAMGVMAILKKPLDPKQLLEKLQELSEETATLIDRSPAEPSATPPAGAPAAEPAGQNSASGTEAGSMKIEQMLGWSLPGEQSAGSPENDETKTQKRPRPASPEADLEQTMVVPPGAGTQAGTPEPSASPGADMEQTMVVPPSAPAVPSDMEQTTVVPTPPASPAGGTPSAAPSEGPLKAPLNESQVADLVKTAARDVMENVIWDILPGVAEMQMKRFNPPAGAEPSAVASKPVLSGQEADMQVGDVAKDMMEKAAWDAVPEMAGNELQGTPGGPGASPPGGKSGPGEAEARQLVEQLAKEVIERVAWEVVPALAEDIINKELEKIKTRQ